MNRVYNDLVFIMFLFFRSVYIILFRFDDIIGCNKCVVFILFFLNWFFRTFL